MGDTHEIQGYRGCRSGCGTLVLEVVARQTSGFCVDCWDAGKGLHVAEVINRGVRVPMKRGSKRKKNGFKGLQSTHVRANHARRAALRRLRTLHPAMYDLLYDEERARRGLPPVVRRNAQPHELAVTETLTFEDVYDALRLSGEQDVP